MRRTQALNSVAHTPTPDLEPVLNWIGGLWSRLGTGEVLTIFQSSTPPRTSKLHHKGIDYRSSNQVVLQPETVIHPISDGSKDACLAFEVRVV